MATQGADANAGIRGAFQTAGTIFDTTRKAVYTVGLLSTAWGAYKVYSYAGGVGNWLGESFAKIPNIFIDATAKAIDETDVEQVVAKMAEKIISSIKSFDFAGILKEIGDHQTELRDWFHKHSTEWVNNSIDLAKQTVTGHLPWFALGSIVMTGTPLLLRYAYHYAIENIGMPKLIQERKSYTWLARFHDVIVNTFSWSTGNISNYMKTNFKIYGVVLGTSLFTNAVFKTFDALGAIKQDSSIYTYVKDNVVTPFEKLNSDFFCLMSGGSLIDDSHLRKYYQNVCDNSKNQWLSFNNLVTVATVLATSGLIYNNMKALYTYFFVTHPAEGKPIFSAQLQSRVDEITSSLSNLKKHGGFLPNILLYGPGGTGKTMIAKYIARNSGTNYVMMSGGDLAQFIRKGQHVTKLNELMEWINKQHEPTVLFIDECEALCKNRSRVTRPEDLELVNAFLNHTGEASKKLMLIMATNDKDLDPAVLSRCDYKLPVLPPAKPERIKILNKYAQVFFSSWEIRTFFNEQKIDAIADKTEGLTGRALFKMLNAINNKKKSTRGNKLTKTPAQPSSFC